LTFDDTIHEGWNTFEWSGVKPAYQKYKLSGTTVDTVKFAEIKLFGVVVIEDNHSSTTCVPKAIIGGVTTNLNPIVYSDAATPVVASLSQRFGNVVGGESLVIKGQNFGASTSVTIDGITCAIQTSSNTELTCVLGSRPGDDPEPAFKVFSAGMGLAANKGHTFRYVQYWSEPSTWGGDAPPQFGEAV
jgi:hypothetical protein